MREERERVAARLRTTLDLFEAGLDLQRQALRRAHPDASEAEVQRRLAAWLRDRAAREFDAPHLTRRAPAA